MRTQYTFVDPTTLYADISTRPDDQTEPGLDAELRDRADLGEETYVGTGRLKGRKALVTGGDSGIGAATVIAFAREGADVALAYLPPEQVDAERVAAIAREAGVVVALLPGDLSVHAEAVALVDDAVAQLGGLDILVNNAGKQIYNEDLTTLPDEQFDDTFKVNVYAMFWITKAALGHLPPGSTIINTTSVQAYSPSDILVDYASTKATINAFTKALAQQVGPKGIRVNAVAPGPVWTPLQVTDGQPSDAIGEFGQSTPLGRAGQPAELAPAYVFLASAESSYVSGETLNVNGGMPTP
ncbi:NAD(P)-dependent dehydrogenase [Serinibacter arcticus]|uniref:NAD(P)-dependent dehydrogenase n=1 Tax=Serinibacter arcticus TaxID=1655435 RepID=A0A2U1ZR58_9MICO|nr:SDR family oxidoreductase [Serinibacter arcticus]PWD49392.1 NAD(P)-dependent dehydrogenase [Serinibacter arcticus]